MMKFDGLVLGIVAIVVLGIFINIGISIYEPRAIENAVKATTNQTFTVSGTSYTVTGNGNDAQTEAQATHDNVTLIRTVTNALLGVVFLILVIMEIIGLLSRKKHG